MYVTPRDLREPFETLTGNGIDGFKKRTPKIYIFIDIFFQIN